MVIDDYGHHPTEIRATLAAARACKLGRIHVLFQPHRYTRTQALLDEFGGCFHQADNVFVVDIYPASEKPIAGVTSQALVDRMQAFGHRNAHYSGAMQDGISAVIAAAQEGDAILTLGAGSVSQAGETILERLESSR
jgi:UDP-N-acetylmuramate--alanine ligase